MSISTRGLAVAANSANVARDYALLQAPDDSVKLFPDLEGDETEQQLEDD